jgi:hypothetical protein
VQASLTCSISPDAAITNLSNMGGLEGKEVKGGGGRGGGMVGGGHGWKAQGRGVDWRARGFRGVQWGSVKETQGLRRGMC